MATEPAHYDEGSGSLDAMRLMICDILRKQVGHDFSGYRSQTFLRRVDRRMHVVNAATMQDYIAKLNADHDEVTHLFRDLLIRSVDETAVPASKDFAR